ncbi:YqcC family protein [Arsenophonus endosymbiont of Aleurodicus floccissimus]
MPKLYKFIEQHIDLPNAFAITPYFEEIYQEERESLAIANYLNIYVC